MMDDDHHHHDHGVCVSGALKRAEAVCGASGAKLTPLRRRVLELLWSDHKPRGAYALLEDLARESERKVAPLTVYRALDFLVEQGLAHRIESLNAYLGCVEPEHRHASQFLVCERCGTAWEIADQTVSNAVESSARALGFAVHRQTVEITGLCDHCQSTPP